MVKQQSCARCHAEFLCHQDDIQHCFCNQLKLSSQILATIASSYDGCLCSQCLSIIQNEQQAISAVKD